jgi:hypothetical protein
MSARAGLHDLDFDPDPAQSISAHRHEPSYWFFMADCWDECAVWEASRGNRHEAAQYRREAAMWRDWAFMLARRRRSDAFQRRLAQSVRS